MGSHDVSRGLKSIRGIGDKTAQLLVEIGIASAEELLAYRGNEEALRKTLADGGIRGLTHERVQAWFEDAAAQRASRGEMASIGAAPSSDQDLDASSWTPRAEFTVFFDSTTPDTDDANWRCRVYHAESGEEVALNGLTSWLDWLADRLGVPVDRIVPPAARVASGLERRSDSRGGSAAPGLEVDTVQVSHLGHGRLGFSVTFATPREAEPPGGEILTAHIDLVCLDDQGRAVLAESWDEPIDGSTHTASRATTGLEVGSYDVKATVSLVASQESAERRFLLDVVP